MRISHCITTIFLIAGSLAYSQNQTLKRSLNLNDAGVAIKGYDPVSYFGGTANEGSKEFSLSSEGAIYYFSSSANRDTFKANPGKYTPQYGGWCAYAMGDSGDLVEVDPETFKIVGGKLYLFYNKLFNNTLNSWNKNEADLKNRADKNWQRYK